MFVQLFKLVGMLCPDMEPCWRPPCHFQAWGAIRLARRGQITPGYWNSLGVKGGHVFPNTINQIYRERYKGQYCFIFILSYLMLFTVVTSKFVEQCPKLCSDLHYVI